MCASFPLSYKNVSGFQKERLWLPTCIPAGKKRDRNVVRTLGETVDAISDAFAKGK